MLQDIKHESLIIREPLRVEQPPLGKEGVAFYGVGVFQQRLNEKNNFKKEPLRMMKIMNGMKLLRGIFYEARSVCSPHE